MNTPAFVYDDIDVRKDIADAHRQTWNALAQAGAFWSDVDRIEIAKQRGQREPGEMPINLSVLSITAQALDVQKRCRRRKNC